MKQQNGEFPPNNVVDLNGYRSRKERRKAQKKALIYIQPKEPEPPREAGTPRPQRTAKKKTDRKPMSASLRKALIIVIAVLLCAAGVLLILKLFTVREISVSGGVNYTENEILKAVGLREGQSMFSVNENRIRGKLVSTPQLQLESVQKRFPGKVVLKVTETTPTVVVAFLNTYVTLDEQLRVISREYTAPDGSYPKVTGMIVRQADQAAKVEADDPKQAEALEAILTALGRRSGTAGEDTYAPLHYITEIRLADIEHLKLVTEQGYTVELGDASNMVHKALWIEQMIPMFIEKGYNGGTLDVSGSNSATFIPSEWQNEGQKEGTENMESQSDQPETVQETVPEDVEKTTEVESRD